MADVTTPTPSPLEVREVTIANGESLSEAVNLGGRTLVGISMPSAWTAANLTFQSAPNGSTYQNVYEETGSERVVTAAAASEIQLDPAVWAGIRYLKVRSGTSGSAVNQGAARTIRLITRHI